MAEDQKKTTGNSIDDTIFQDLLSDSRISSLEIKEPEFDSFDVQSVIQEARTVSSAKKSPANPFGKRSRRNKTARQEAPAFNEQSFFATKAQRRQEQESAAMAQDLFKDANSEETTPQAGNEPAAAQQSPSSMPAAESSAPEQELPAFMQTRQEQTQPQKPKTFAEILHNARYQENQKALENMDLFDDPVIETPLFQQAQASEPAPASEPSVVITRKSQSELLLQAQNETEAVIEEEIEQEPVQDTPAQPDQPEPELKEPKEKRSRKNKAAAADQTEEEEEIFDPGASIVDDYHYDEYEDKKRFSTTDYRKIEDYLTNESAQGFHFVRQDGNKYFFNKSTPHHYYYKVLYFGREPEDSYWNLLEKQGWKRIEQLPSRHKRDAGWYIVRNEKKAGELPKDIENEEEKYRYFTKLSSSCRSTMFLLFIVMVCSAIAVFLQYYFKGYIAVMIASAVLFFIALWIFLVYARMLSKARKQASLLSARIRLASNDPNYLALRHAGESDEQLDLDWDKMDAQDKLREQEEQDQDPNADDAYDDEDYRIEDDDEEDYDEDEEEEDEKPRRKRWGRRRR